MDDCRIVTDLIETVGKGELDKKFVLRLTT
jgi:hypothetical protein